ncbi:MAG: hypothetical protein JJE47_16810 [Acidimicrobiia bacterium]|nr:hypothetical protein [Acidimicrobiia bacterium]
MKILACVFVFAVLVAACGGQTIHESTPVVPTVTGPVESTTTGGSLLVPLAEARQLWAAVGYTSYRYDFDDDCGECQPFTGEVVVTDGEVVAPADRGLTVDEMFAAIERAVAAGVPVEVTFDPQIGYPTDLWIDREARAYDGGTHWLLRNLVPLPR